MHGIHEVTMTISPRFRLASLVLAGILSLAAGPPDYKTPGKDWGKGPVKWIMTDEEEKEWKKLRTDEERAAFVKSFWEKRDPTPGTPENEYQVIFWKKVEEAEKAFKTQTTDYGSLTDRGRVYLLIGPPAKMDKDTRGHIIWIYEPNEILGITTRYELMFAAGQQRSEEHTSELQSRLHLVCRLLLEKKKKNNINLITIIMERMLSQFEVNTHESTC